MFKRRIKISLCGAEGQSNLCTHPLLTRLVKYPWPTHSRSFTGTYWGLLYSFSYRTDYKKEGKKESPTLNNCEVPNKRKWRSRATGNPPNTVQEQQHSQACMCMCACVCRCVCMCVVGLADVAADSPFMTAVLIFLETTEAVCCVGSLPLDNSNLQKIFVWAQCSVFADFSCFNNCFSSALYSWGR